MCQEGRGPCVWGWGWGGAVDIKPWRGSGEERGRKEEMGSLALRGNYITIRNLEYNFKKVK